MSGLNRVTLLGNVGADPELRYTANGTAVLNIRLATSETYVDKNKEVQERTDWHAVVVWGPRAAGLAKVVVKGACVLVEGGLRTSSYEKDGVKRYKTEVHAREICFTGKKTPPEGAPGHVDVVGSVPARAGQKGSPQPGLAFEPNDQIPF